MKITAKGQSALKAMLVLAVHDPERLSVKMIAEKQNLSPRYLEQIFSTLKNSHLIHGIKGPSGGYCLGKKPDQISLYDIVKCVEGSHPFSQEGDQDVIGQVIANRLGVLDQSIRTYLQDLSLEDLCKDYESKTHEGYMYFI